MKKKIVLSSIATVALVSLVGCGGGSTPPAEEVTTSTLSGVAVDELILNGKVKVSKPDKTLLVEGRTSDTDGTYTLDVENYTGPVVVNVTCDANSSLLIGAAKEVCPSDVDLNSVANANGKEVTINVSPLTDITYQRAVSLGGGTVTETSVAKASNEIALVFGVDPIQNNPTSDTYTDIIQSFHAVAEADAGKDLFNVIDDFAEDMSDGTVDNSDALINAMQDANVANPLTINDESYVIPENPASADDQTELKTMIQSLRTQGTTMQSYAESEAEAMGTALDSVALDIQTVSDYVLGITDLVVQASTDGNTTLGGQIEVTLGGEWVPIDVDVVQSTTNPNEWTYSTMDGEYTGNIILPEITEGIEYTFTSLNANFSGTLPYVNDIYSDTPDVQTQNVSLNLALAKTGDIVNATLSDFSIENSGNKISIDSLTGSVSYTAPSNSDEDPVFNYVKFDAMTLTAVAGDYTATGTLSVPEYAINTSLESRGGFEEVPTTYAGLSIYCSNSSTISNMGATLSIGGENYTYHQDYGTNTSAYLDLDNISGHYTESEIANASTITATCSDNSAPIVHTWAWNDTDIAIGNSGNIPKKVAFEGSLKNTKTDGELSGTVNIELLNAQTLDLTTDISETNEPALKVDLSGKLLMPQRPETLLNLSYETKVNDDAHRHSVTGSYSYDTTLITVAGSVDKTGKNANLAFTNGSGITADFILANDAFVNGNVANTTGSLVKKDGKVVATIEERNDDVIVIKYLDGSFESIF